VVLDIPTSRKHARATPRTLLHHPAKFLTPKDLGELYGLGHDAAYLLAHEIGVIRFGTKSKLVKVPRSAVMRDLQRRAAL
jgi:hypothetical protein